MEVVYQPCVTCSLSNPEPQVLQHVYLGNLSMEHKILRLSICLQDNSEQLWIDFDEIFKKCENWQLERSIDFGCDPDHLLETGIFNRFFYHFIPKQY